MPKNYTENYNLSQWAPEDAVLRADFNADNAKIDEALAELSKTVAKHTSQMNDKGNCFFFSIGYEGDGKAGAGNPTKIGFPKRPGVVFIADWADGGTIMTIVAGQTQAYARSSSNMPNQVTWDGITPCHLSWYSPDANPAAQMNVAGKLYIVNALIPLV